MRRSTRAFLAAAVMTAIIVGVFLTWTWLQWGGIRRTIWMDDLGELAATLIAAGACGFAAWRHSGRGRIAWALFGASALSWGAADVAWCWYELVQAQSVPFPSLADAGYLTAMPLAVAATLTFPGSARRSASRVASGLDGLIIASGILAISWITVMHAVYQAGGDGLFVQVLSISYPVCDVVIATMLFTLLLRAPQTSRLPLALLATGLLGNAIADSGFAYISASGLFSSGNPLGTGWFAGYLLVALGALRAAQLPMTTATVETLPSRWRMLMPYLPMIVAVAAAARQVLVAGSLEPVIFWLLAALIMLFIGRQWLTLADNHSLLEHLGANEAKMRHQALHDPLTGLPNRALFTDRVDAALRHHDYDGGELVAVMVIDLDDFKEINDSYGHETGDQVLVGVSQRLVASVRPSDTAVRLGGDEFAVVIESVSGRRAAEQIATRVVAALNASIQVGPRRLTVRASVGLALARAGSMQRLDLVHRADVAMYRAKAEGKGCFVTDDSFVEAAPGPRFARAAGAAPKVA